MILHVDKEGTCVLDNEPFPCRVMRAHYEDLERERERWMVCEYADNYEPPPYVEPFLYGQPRTKKYRPGSESIGGGYWDRTGDA